MEDSSFKDAVICFVLSCLFRLLLPPIAFAGRVFISRRTSVDSSGVGTYKNGPQSQTDQA